LKLNFNTISGAPVLVLVFLINIFFTNLNLNLNPTFAFFIFYGGFYIIIELYKGKKLNSLNLNVFLLHFFLIIYAFFTYYFFELDLAERDNSNWWRLDSSSKFLAVMIAALVIILSPYEKIIKSLLIIRNFSYLLIIGSFFYYFLPSLGITFLSSDELAGSRYNGGINSYILTGQFIIAGFISHLALNKNLNFYNTLISVFFYSFAIVATKDRTSIGAMLIIYLFLFLRSGFGVSPFNFKLNKLLVIFLLIPFILGLGFVQIQNINSGNLEFYKSTFHRAAITIRSYELFKEVMPAGAGPGSQAYLMLNDKIKANFIDDKNIENSISLELIRNIEGLHGNVGSGLPLSPHNTYFDFLIPFGLAGLIFISLIIFTQLKSLKRLIFNKKNPSIFVDVYLVSGIFFFMFSSLFNVWWLYIIFYRLFIFIKSPPIKNSLNV